MRPSGLGSDAETNRTITKLRMAPKAHHGPSLPSEGSLRVGGTLRARRHALGMSLEALAAASRVSAAMIAAIERVARSPTLSVLEALAEPLAVPVAALVEEPVVGEVRVRVDRAAARPVHLDPKGVRRESLGPTVMGSRTELLRLSLPPATATDPFALHAPGTIARVHLAQGAALRVRFGVEEAVLAADDACVGPADRPHRLVNEGAMLAIVYILIERL